MIVLPTAKNIQKAVDLLRKGELIGLPTETVYGLAGDASSDAAVAHIFSRKNRPSFNPLIIHGASHRSFDDHVIWTKKAEILADTFWPGPLTLVLPKRSSSSLSLLASAGLSSLAVRVPQHPIARELLKMFGGLVAAPSANISGTVSPTQSQHVEKDFPDLFVFEGGSSPVGLESTIIDCTTSSPCLLRPGGISVEKIKTVVGRLERPMAPSLKAPGLLKSHYAPHLPVRPNAEFPLEGEAYLAFGSTVYQGDHVLNLSATSDLEEAAANFFNMMRLLDKSIYQGIAVAPIPLRGLGLALNDRLKRAAATREP